MVLPAADTGAVDASAASMSAKRRRSRGGKGPRGRPQSGGAGSESRGRIGVRRLPDEGVFELVYPRCVQQRQEDIEEVRRMLEAGEVEIAVDELRWLLQDCRELIEAHKLLGEIALSDGDLPLARGHLGYAYDLGRAAIPPGGLTAPLPATREANRPLFEAGKHLIWCLVQQGEKELAREVVEYLLGLDPSDPLGLRGLLGDAGS